MTYFSKLSEQHRPRKLIGFIGFDGVTTLDLTGPLEAFANARLHDQPGGEPSGYETIVIAAGKKTFISQSGMVFKARHTLGSAPQLDTIVVPGGASLRDSETGGIIAAWLQSRAKTTRRIASVSGGIYAFARSGLLDGLPVTTHWKFAQNVARQFPTLQMNTAASFVKHDSFYTCGGGTAGIEMSLALIEEDYGVKTALGVARELVMSLRPAAGLDQEEAFDYQPGAEERLAELPGWITSRLRQNLSVEVLAERACLCPRHFSRIFKQTFQSTPADFVELLRIKEAARRLVGHRDTIESIASSVGFKSAEVFRRAFERRFGMTPRQFQKRNPKPSEVWTNARSLQRN